MKIPFRMRKGIFLCYKKLFYRNSYCKTDNAWVAVGFCGSIAITFS